MLLSVQGKIKRIFPTITRKSASGKEYASRKFWLETDDPYFGGSGDGQIVEFSIFTLKENHNPNFARVEDLDVLSDNTFIRFSFQIKSVCTRNKRTNEEVCYTNLSVASRIEVMTYRKEYQQATAEKVAKNRANHAKQVETALNDMAQNITAPF